MAHCKKLPRRPLPGMLLHRDTSLHAPGSTAPRRSIWWSPSTTPPPPPGLDPGAIRRSWSRRRASSFRGLAEVVAAKGLFCALYTDRASHYFHTPAAGGTVSRTQPTQVGRALQRLGIEHIAAYSPSARRPLRARLPDAAGPAAEGAAAGRHHRIEAANRWLAEVYLPEHNARFAVPEEPEGSAFVADRTGSWRDILCVQEERIVGNDNTVKWKRLSLQIPPLPLRPHFVRAKVRVHE